MILKSYDDERVAKVLKKDGKGNAYVDVISAHMPILEVM